MPKTFDLSATRRVAQRVRDTVRDARAAVDRTRADVRRDILPFTRRDIQTEYNIPARRLMKDLASRNGSNGAIEVIGYARPIGKIEFAGRWKGRNSAGATAQVKTASGRKTYDGSFIGVGKRGTGKGNRHIFERTTARRLPIQALYGPSAAQMLRRPGRAERLADFARDLLVRGVKRRGR